MSARPPDEQARRETVRRSKRPGESDVPESRLRRVARSFDCATQGVQLTFRTERHMRLHFVVALVVALWALALRLPILELLFVYSAIIVVILTEMLNTALENLVDLAADGWDIRAKRVKDIAAGVVLTSVVYAVAVWAIVFLAPARLNELWNAGAGLWFLALGNSAAAHVHLEKSTFMRSMPYVHLGVTGLVMLALAIIIFKERIAKGRFVSGGWVSGHAALAVYVAAFLIFIARGNPWVTLGALVLSVLVIQSRVEGRIHTWPEVGRGALLGTGLATLLYILGAAVPGGLAG
jgi:diacylglycerol kinase (ATP)